MTHTLVEPHVAPVVPRANRRRRDSRFYTAMGIVAFLVTLVGFNGAIRGTTGEIAALVRVHAVLYTTWLALFVAQSRLVATGRIALHRRLGVFGAALATTICCRSRCSSLSRSGSASGRWRTSGSCCSPPAAR
jgi:hypothetical protein